MKAFPLGLALAAGLSQTATSPHPATPTEPIDAILQAFKTYEIVALGEGAHNNEQGHAFRLKLLRDPSFVATVDDILVECGSSRYQDVIDRFERGEDVPYDELRHVWEDTTMGNTVWDPPIYEEFFRAVRAVNAAAPKDHPIRVLLGDPPIDWSAIHSPADLMKWMRQRDSYPISVIQHEVIAKHHRALVVYGDGHLGRKDWESIVTALEQGGTKVFSISTAISTRSSPDPATLEADIASWPVPSLAMLAGTVLGAKDVAFYSGIGTNGPDAQPRGIRMEDQFDAWLDLGPPSIFTMSRITAAKCRDPKFMEMRLARLRLMLPPPGTPADGAQRLIDYCTSVTKN